MKTGSKFPCSYEHLKLLFYSNFNAFYRRSNSSHSELVSVQLLQSFCLPVVLYGSEVTEQQISVLAMLSNLINGAVYKIFKVSDKDVICYIRQCLGLHDIDVLCKERHERFLRRTGLLRLASLALSDSSVQFLSFNLCFSLLGFLILLVCMSCVFYVLCSYCNTVCFIVPPCKAK